MRAPVDERRPRDAAWVHPWLGVEVAVLDGDDGVGQHRPH